MAWRDEQSQRRKLRPQPKKNSGEDFFFATMRTATKENQLWRGIGGRLPQGRGYRYAMCLNVRIEFDAAGYVNSVSRNTECCPSFDVAQFWYAHQIEESEHWRD